MQSFHLYANHSVPPLWLFTCSTSNGMNHNCVILDQPHLKSRMGKCVMGFEESRSQNYVLSREDFYVTCEADRINRYVCRCAVFCVLNKL